MPDAASRRREAEIAEVAGTLAAARCAARLAGLGTGEFAVRELLLGVIEQIDRAERAVSRLSVLLPSQGREVGLGLVGLVERDAGAADRQ